MAGEKTAENTTKVTSISIIRTGEGDRIAFTYSVLNQSGEIVESNVKGKPFVAVGTKAEATMKALYELAAEHIG